MQNSNVNPNIKCELANQSYQKTNIARAALSICYLQEAHFSFKDIYIYVENKMVENDT